MPTRPLTKAILWALLATAVAQAPAQTYNSDFVTWARIALLLLGTINIAFSPPSTSSVQGLTVVGVFAGVLIPDLRFFVVFLLWLIWPPVFLINFALARGKHHVETPGETDPDPAVSGLTARVGAAAVVAGVAAASVAYRVLVDVRMNQSAGLFVGLPALLAIVVIMAVTPRSAVGVAVKAVTVGLLLSLVMMWEGILCIVMSAPIFYAVAISMAAAADRMRKAGPPSRSFLSGLVLLIVAPLSLEGLGPHLSFRRSESVEVTRDLDAPLAAVERALLSPPRFARALPAPLRVGFPRPLGSSVDADAMGTLWKIEMRGGETFLNGMEPRTGALVMRLENRRAGHLEWQAVADDSHMTHFLNWERAIVDWQPVDPETTRVTWTIHYRRGLDPAWYFGPMERYAVRLAAGYLIDAVATP